MRVRINQPRQHVLAAKINPVGAGNCWSIRGGTGVLDGAALADDYRVLPQNSPLRVARNTGAVVEDEGRVWRIHGISGGVGSPSASQ